MKIHKHTHFTVDLGSESKVVVNFIPMYDRVPGFSHKIQMIYQGRTKVDWLSEHAKINNRTIEYFISKHFKNELAPASCN